VRLQATTGTVGQTDNGAIVASLLGVRAGANVVLDTATNDSDATRSMPAGWSPIRTATT
jgi:hypothetical protein